MDDNEQTKTSRTEEKEDQAPVHGRLPERLTDRERKAELRNQEAVIERFRRAGLEAGAALHIIRSQRLYRNTVIDGVRIRTFSEYCKLRWDFDAARGRQLINAARGAEMLRAETGIAPRHEGQVRPLLRMLNSEAAEQREIAVRAWERAASGPGTTESVVRAAIQEVTPQSTTGAEATTTAKSTEEVPGGGETHLDIMRWVGDLESRLFAFIDLLETFKGDPNNEQRRTTKAQGMALIKELRTALQL